MRYSMRHGKIEPSNYSHWIFPENWNSLRWFLCDNMWFIQNLTKFHYLKKNTFCRGGFIVDHTKSNQFLGDEPVHILEIGSL
jgi:hypothetical protein